MNTTAFEIVMSMALALFGAPSNVQLLTSDKPACEARDHTAGNWRKAGQPVFVYALAPWCIVASIQNGVWRAEQWTQTGSGDRHGLGQGPQSVKSRSHGWAVQIPISALPGPGSQPHAHRLAPGVEIQAFRYPGLTLEQAHRQRLSAIAPEAAPFSFAMNPATESSGKRFRIHRMQQGTAVVTVITVQSAFEDPLQVQVTESQL
ncbi:MAG: hypothetical protein FJY35_08575 [Betaproteobacteria bacterium]|jgi:hypothetical protein|nr:hypothetical protein [Betaproteobacteria bacterium]